MKHLISLEKISLLVGILGFGLPRPALAASTDTFHFRCSSQEIGLVELKLSNPRAFTYSGMILSYDADISRSDLDGKLLQTTHYISDSGNDAFKADLDTERGVIDFRIPIGSVDWSKNDNECFAASSMPGVWFEIDGASGSLSSAGGGESILILEAQNPRVVGEIVPAWPYSISWPFLDGKKCAAQLGDSRKASAPIQCMKLNN